MPTDLPVAKWKQFESRDCAYYFRYPPCWTLQQPDEGGALLFLSSPDGSFEIEIQVVDPHDAHSRADATFEESAEVTTCRTNGRDYRCTGNEIRSGYQTFLAVFGKRHAYMISTTEQPESRKWRDEGMAIIASLRLGRPHVPN